MRFCAATGATGNQADNSASDSGAVYVFRRSGTAWQQEAYLEASNTGAIDFFGTSVALDGDTLAVGAYLEDSAATGVNGNQADNSASDSGPRSRATTRTRWAAFSSGRRSTARPGRGPGARAAAPAIA